MIRLRENFARMSGKAEKARSHYFYLQLHFVKKKEIVHKTKADRTENCFMKINVKKRSFQMTYLSEGRIKNEYLQFGIRI